MANTRLASRNWPWNGWLCGYGRCTSRFRAVVREHKEAALDYGELRAALAKGQNYLLRAVACVYGCYNSDSADDIAARKRFLHEIFKQNDAIAKHRRGRRSVPDIGPRDGRRGTGRPGRRARAERHRALRGTREWRLNGPASTVAPFDRQIRRSATVVSASGTAPTYVGLRHVSSWCAIQRRWRTLSLPVTNRVGHSPTGRVAIGRR